MKSTTLADKRFQKGLFSQIANLVPRDEEGNNITIPTIIKDIDNNEIEISFDDRYPFSIYHRVVSLQYGEGLPEGDANLITETANMLAIVYGDRNILMLSQEQLVSGVQSGFIQGLSDAQKQEWNLTFADISTGNVNLNSKSVYAEELGNAPYQLKPNSILFSLAYTIITEYKSNCLDIC
jgi:hypothetical protein